MERRLLPWVAAAIILALALNVAVNNFVPLLRAVESYAGEISREAVMPPTATVMAEEPSGRNATALRAIVVTTSEPATKLPESENIEMGWGEGWGAVLSAASNIALSLIIAVIIFLALRLRWRG